MDRPGLILRRLPGPQDYQATWDAMRVFTAARDAATPDEIWLLEHPPIFTLGQAGHPEHLLDPGTIPVIRTDRGGQVTCHGLGQLIAYVLFDLRRGGIGVKRLMHLLEQAVIDLLAAWGISAAARPAASGVDVDGAKIVSLGLRGRQGCSYHGAALNIDLELEPFWAHRSLWLSRAEGHAGYRSAPTRGLGRARGRVWGRTSQRPGGLGRAAGLSPWAVA